MLSNDELIKIGVNPDNLNYPHGEMNVIVQCLGCENDEGTVSGYDEELDKDVQVPMTEVSPDIYHPRKNSVWSCGCKGDDISIEGEENKKDWVRHLRDSAERLKIMAYYLTKQADEIEEFGFPKTSLYYPE